MSLSLIKRGLELIEDDLDSKLDSGLRRTKKSKSKSKKKGNTSLSERKVQNTLESYAKRIKKDQTQSNLKTLQRVDAKLNLNASASKVKEHQLRNLARKAEAASAESKPKSRKKDFGEKSVFSEEDFEKINEKWLSLM